MHVEIRALLHDFELTGHVLEIADFVLERDQLVRVVAPGLLDVRVLLVDELVELVDASVQDLRADLVERLQLLHRQIALRDVVIDLVLEQLRH